MSNCTQPKERAAAPGEGWPAALLRLVERMEEEARAGGIRPALLRKAAMLLPPGAAGDALRLELERMAAKAAIPARPSHELCTVSDGNYLPRLFALIASLERCEPGSYRLQVACLDETAATVLARLKNPAVVPIPVAALEGADPQLAAVRSGRSVAEYSWTLKPTLLLGILERDPAIEVLTYLDGDLFFFAPVRQLLDELGSASVLIHRHNFSSECAPLEAQSGPYNAGMVAFRNDPRARAVLRWWRERCLEWCFNRFEDGKFADQTYLTSFRARCDAVSESRRLSVGTALWSQGRAPIGALPSGAPSIGSEPIVFYHAHGFATVRPGLHVPSKDLYYRPTLSLVRNVYLPYIRAVEEGAARVQSVWPAWRPGSPFTGLTPQHAVVAERKLRPLLRQAGLGHPIVELDDAWDCHAGPQLRME
ncbi:MAG TPA: hypothetical protein VFG59_04715 [Anaeromyxobacter sp.]|nr:hypothetical protein [Anaeromyxobacter sp.]